jgi:hypothetical protein
LLLIKVTFKPSEKWLLIDDFAEQVNNIALLLSLLRNVGSPTELVDESENP